MQRELDEDGYSDRIRILGINSIGSESGNDYITLGRNIPWLQDVPLEHVWDSWRVNYRDVVILNTRGETSDVFNLTAHDLTLPENYETLKTILLETP